VVAQAFALGATAVVSRPREIIFKLTQIEAAEKVALTDFAITSREIADGAAAFASMFSSAQDGKLINLATFALDGPEKCRGLPVTRYDPARLGQTLVHAFQLVHTRRHTHATPWGSDQSFQFSVFRHRSSSASTT
jgi:hypothetical protein